MTVQPGATWHDIQNVLHPRFAVKAMQSTDIFSVGGSISVNAHGMDHQAGSVAGSIRSMRVMLADGSVIDLLARRKTPISSAMSLAATACSAWCCRPSSTSSTTPSTGPRATSSAPRTFRPSLPTTLEPDRNVGLFYGHLSTSPGNFLEDMIVYRYDKVADEAPADQPPLGEPGASKLKRLIINLAKLGGLFQRLKWFTEKNLEPEFESCTVARTAAMGEGEACLVTRNNPMHDSVPYLFNDLAGETDILHEYFIPRGAYNDFIAGAREIMRAQDCRSSTPRSASSHKEDVALTYAPEPVFALVLYINQNDRRGRQPADAGADAGADRPDDPSTAADSSCPISCITPASSCSPAIQSCRRSWRRSASSIRASCFRRRSIGR